MENTIVVKDIIHSEYAVTGEMGLALFNEFKKYDLKDNDVIIIDFEGIERATTLFFNESISQYVKDNSYEKFKTYFKLENMTKTLKILFKNSLELTINKMNNPDIFANTLREELKDE